MAKAAHVKLVRRGSEAIAEWRELHPDIQLDLERANLSEVPLAWANLSEADLSEANLCDSDLNGADLIGAELIGANLTGADLGAADLTGADLTGAILHSANLRGADLRDTDLSDADFRGADLQQSDLSGAYLHGANFESATFYDTKLGNLDLSRVTGLREVKHSGPSTVGVDTLYRSQGKIPDEFLRGCGVHDGLITYLPSLLGAQQPIEFYSCFISYSHSDEEFCKRLYSRMRDEKLRIWYAPEDIQGGKKLHEQIDHAIRVHDKLLLVLTDRSMKSEWVATEIYKARQRETKEGKQVLFPIRLVDFERIRDWQSFDADTGKDMAREVREYFIPDFSNWKDHDAFEAAFQKLLSALKSADKKP